MMLVHIDRASHSMDKILGAESYGKFRHELSLFECAKCGMATNRTALFVDEGNPDAKVLFITDVPGDSKNLEEANFLGQSGVLLNEMLRGVGFSLKNDALIASVVKCLPPNVSSITHMEISTCLTFLKKQIELMQPSLIVLLGAAAFQCLFPGRNSISIDKEAGRLFENPDYPDAKFMLLYHPALIANDPRRQSATQKHLQSFVKLWKTLP